MKQAGNATKRGDSTCWPSTGRAQRSTFAKEDCVCVQPPPTTGTSDRRGLNSDLMGIKHRAHRPSSSLANSMRSHHGRSDWLPHTKRPLKCCWLTIKSYCSQKDTICHASSFFVHAYNNCCTYIYWIDDLLIIYCMRNQTIHNFNNCILHNAVLMLIC